MHRSAELHLHRGGPFVRLAMCATLVYLACGLVQLVFDLASSLSISLSFFSPPPSFPSSTCRSSFLRPPREHSKNWRRLLSSPLLSSLSSSLEPRRSHEQCSSTLVRRDLNLDNLTCKRNRGRSYVPRSTRDLFTAETGGERSEEFHPHRRLMGSRHFKRVPPVETLNSNYRPMISAKFSPL